MWLLSSLLISSFGLQWNDVYRHWCKEEDYLIVKRPNLLRILWHIVTNFHHYSRFSICVWRLILTRTKLEEFLPKYLFEALVFGLSHTELSWCKIGLPALPWNQNVLIVLRGMHVLYEQVWAEFCCKVFLSWQGFRKNARLSSKSVFVSINTKFWNIPFEICLVTPLAFFRLVKTRPSFIKYRL